MGDMIKKWKLIIGEAGGVFVMEGMYSLRTNSKRRFAPELIVIPGAYAFSLDEYQIEPACDYEVDIFLIAPRPGLNRSLRGSVVLVSLPLDRPLP
jgi:hypothetical protein